MATLEQTHTILVADDDPILGPLLGRFLEGRGMVALVASDGADALRILNTYPDEIGLLVADVVMPTMGGFELAARAVDSHPELRVLYMSGYIDDSLHVSQGVREAGRFFLKKPFSRETFVQLASEAVSEPPPRPTDGFAFLLGYPPITARVMQEWQRSPQTDVRDLRYELELPARYRLSGDQRWLRGHTTNVSRTGIRLETDEPLVGDFLNRDLHVQLELPNPGIRCARMAAMGRVARVESTTDHRSALGIAVSHYHPDIRR